MILGLFWRPKPGLATEDEVRRRWGMPDEEWTEGMRRCLAWSRQPEGTENLLAVFGADGVLIELRQLLEEANIAAVPAGSRREAVRRALGRPASTAVYARKGDEVWEWKFADRYGAEQRLTATFDMDGRLRAIGISAPQSSAP